MNDIEAIASRHLGKAGDGTVVAPYQTPDSIDASLLVAVPRSLNREQYNIVDGDLEFVGHDVWNCYEFSTLLDNGYPMSGVVKLSYPSDTLDIVESKSLKLYLNSFNMAKIAGDERNASLNIKAAIRSDLEDLLGDKVQVSFKPYNQYVKDTPLPEYCVIEHHINLVNVKFDAYNEDPALLKLQHAGTSQPQRITTNALRSNCRVTNQPDWGDVFIYIDGPQHLDEVSVLQYIVSMRKENHFHEEIVECIYKRLYDLLPFGTAIAVAALYTRRGGIDINPVRASSYMALKEFNQILDVNQVSPKTSRQ